VRDIEDIRRKVTDLSVKYGFRSTPILDQYFLVDSGVIQREIRYADISKEDTVLEIGPGLGFITEILAQRAKKVIAIEKDKRLEPILKDELAKYSNIELIFEDALKTDFPKFDKIVSNIPYSISAPLTFKMLDYDFKSAVLLYQREFGEKMMYEAGDPKYGRLSVMIQYYFNAELKEIVPRGAFYPQPKVDGAIVVLRKKNILRDAEFDKFVREIFRYKNKNAKNAVELATGKKIEDDRKVDCLGVKEVIELYKKVKEL
jgi:16S rRNA (adenine1518-N6/adenine1519-N6)-dimethyltransferase